MAKDQTEQAIKSLSAETLAFSAILGFVFLRLRAADPRLAAAIAEGFDDAADFVEHFAIKTGNAPSADHTVQALRVVEDIRTTAIGGKGKPKHVV
jgi:hypothetical protein